MVKPMKIEPIADQEVKHLSGGELQRVAIVLALGKPADVSAASHECRRGESKDEHHRHDAPSPNLSEPLCQ